MAPKRRKAPPTQDGEAVIVFTDAEQEERGSEAADARFDLGSVSAPQTVKSLPLQLIWDVLKRRKRCEEELRLEEAHREANEGDAGTAEADGGEEDVQHMVDRLLGHDDPLVDVISSCACGFQRVAADAAYTREVLADQPWLPSLQDGTLLDEWLTGRGVTETALRQLWERMASDPDPSIAQRCSSTLLGLSQPAAAAAAAAGQPMAASPSKSRPNKRAEVPTILRFEWLLCIAERAFGVPAACLRPASPPPPPTPARGIPPIANAMQVGGMRFVADTLAAMLRPDGDGWHSAVVRPPTLTDEELVSVAVFLSLLLVDDRLCSSASTAGALTVRSVTRCLAVVLDGLQRRERGEPVPVQPQPESLRDQLEATFGAGPPPTLSTDLPAMPDYPLVWTYVRRLLAACPHLQTLINPGESCGCAGVHADPLTHDVLGGKPSASLLILCQVLRRLAAEPTMHYAQWALASDALRRLLRLPDDRSHLPRLVPAALSAVLPLVEANRQQLQTRSAGDDVLSAAQVNLLDGLYVALTLTLYAVPYMGDCPVLARQAISRCSSCLAKHVEPLFDLRSKRLIPLLLLLPNMLPRKKKAPPRQRQTTLDHSPAV